MIFCSFGDMRVPGSVDLLKVKSEGRRADHSPMDALQLACKNPERQVVFFAVGFETTAPANAMAVFQAAKPGLRFSCSFHVLVPAIARAQRDAACKVSGGRPCFAIMGTDEYRPIAEKYRVPIVVTGFEPLDILQGVAMCVEQLEAGRAEVEIQYGRCVRPEGNRPAVDLVRQVFEPVNRKWRGIGEIPQSGLGLQEAFLEFDASRRFGVDQMVADEPSECIAGEVLQGHKKPHECPAFGVRCTPDRPLGAPMVSSEGACAAYYRYRRHTK